MAVLQLDTFSVLHLIPFKLDVTPGIICLTGESGSGKSVLLRAIADLIPHQGEASLDNRKCSDVPPPAWRSQVGLLPAESTWWYDTVGEHFSASTKTYSNPGLISELNLPEDSFNWKVSRCSTGEKQRLAIARLLEQQPSVLLLDEPTSSLDNENVMVVERIIKKYSEENEVPVIWVSHDAEQVERVAKETLRIENQQVSEVTI